MSRKLFRLLCPLVMALTLSLLIPSSVPTMAAAGVNLVLLPASQSISAGASFNVSVQAQCGSVSPNAIEIHLDFDPMYLSVQSATSGTNLDFMLRAPAWDNNLGQVDFAAGTLGGPPSGNFTVLTLIFLARKVPQNATSVTFHDSIPRATIAESGGTQVTGSLTGLSFIILPGPASKLAFVTHPGGAAPGSYLNQQPVVAIQDAYGDIVSDNTTAVSLIISGNNSSLLSGNTNVKASNGLAAFKGLIVNQTGAYALVAHSNPALLPATSYSFSVGAGSGGGGGGSGGGGEVPLVNLTLLPQTQVVSLNSSFSVTLRAQCASQATDEIDVFLDFNPSYLSIKSVICGTDLPDFSLATLDNVHGNIDFKATRLGGNPPSGNFTVATLNFQAGPLAPVYAMVTFHRDGSRTTRISLEGNNVTGNLDGGSYPVSFEAPLMLNPDHKIPVSSNQTFDLDIITTVSNSQHVSQVRAFLNFDSTCLEVLQIMPGPGLSNVLNSSFSNGPRGLVSYWANQPSAPYPGGVFTVATVQFRVKPAGSTILTYVTISTSGNETTTEVDFGEAAIPGSPGNSIIVISPQATVDLSVGLQGSSRPDSSWAVPLRVQFFNHGANIFSNKPVYGFNTDTVKSSSKAAVQLSGINPGGYDVAVGTSTTLTSVKYIEVTVPSTYIDMGYLVEGNCNGDKLINIQDFGILAASYGRSSNMTGFDARADLDRSGSVNIADFGLLASHYAMVSPVYVVDTPPVTTLASVSPATSTISANGTFTISINVSQVAGLNAFQFDLSYDSTVIQVAGDENDLSVVTQGLIGYTDVPVEMWGYIPPGVPGKIRVLGRFNTTLSSAYGQGYLAQVQFRALGAPGSSTNLTLSKVSWWNSKGNGTQCSVVNGTVKVQ